MRVSLRMQEALPATLTRAAVSAIEIESDVALPAYSKVVVRGGTLRYRSEHLEHVLFSSAGIDTDIKREADKVRIACPLGQKELRNPREEDEEAAARLVAHPNEHLECYHKVIWWYMDSDRRYMLFDGFLAPNANGRSQDSVCENRIVAIVGNRLALPVASGFALDPMFRRLRENGRPPSLLEHYAPERPLPPLRISLPTKGVFAEAGTPMAPCVRLVVALVEAVTPMASSIWLKSPHADQGRVSTRKASQSPDRSLRRQREIPSTPSAHSHGWAWDTGRAFGQQSPGNGTTSGAASRPQLSTSVVSMQWPLTRVTAAMTRPFAIRISCLASDADIRVSETQQTLGVI